MTEALWLTVTLPMWYFAVLLNPFGMLPVSLVWAVAAACLPVGIALGVRSGHRRRLLLFLVPFILSESLMVAAGILRGQLSGTVTHFVLVNFLVVQVLLSAYLIYLLKGARTPASLLGVFSVTFAAFGAFVAGMSFTDNWL